MEIDFERTKCKKLTNSDLGLSIDTNANKVYYFTYHYKTQKATVYKICVDGTKKTKVFSVKAKDGFELAGLVGGKLYYLTGSDHGNLHSYTLKSKKDKVVVKDIFASRYKSKYFILETLCDDEANVSKISSYSIKNKKLKSISTNVCAYQIIGKKLYYVEYKSTRKNISSDEISNVTVKKCSLNGKNKKTLIKKLTIQNIREVTAHAITYTNKEGKEVKKKY